MQEINVDFHIHSRYSGGTSPDMNIPNLAKSCENKGIDIIATGDCTQPMWLEHIENTLTEEKEGIYYYEGSKTGFLITAEVEDKDRVHHLLLFPDLDSAKIFRNDVKNSSVDIDFEGRPHIGMGGDELVDLANNCDALIGPCHAFTPWTSVYKAFDSLKECYKENLRYVQFIELGLSADSEMADRIDELRDKTFMTNSDAHSPWPAKIGREFNRLRIGDISFDNIKSAIIGEKDDEFILNVGLNPREGKYHETACTRCHLKFKVDDAIGLKRRCPECRGIIKRSVKERVIELSKGSETVHPKGRPPYVYIIPLAEIIAVSRGVKTINSPRIQAVWSAMIDHFGTEISILLDVELPKLADYDKKIAELIGLFRAGKVSYDSGGGGRYGRPIFDQNFKETFYDCSQRSLGEF